MADENESAVEVSKPAEGVLTPEERKHRVSGVDRVEGKDSSEY